MTKLFVPLQWEYFNPVKVVVGAGSLGRLGTFLPREGTALLLTSNGCTRRGLTARVLGMLSANRVLVFDQVTSNPQVDDLDDLTERFKLCEVGCVIALGGGSVMDAAKILGVTLSSNLNRPLNQIFRNGRQNIWASRLPVVCAPTTSGTGAEVTPFATAWDLSDNKKRSVAGDEIYPTIALLDAELTVSLPRDETLYTALDAISHALESLWNKNRTPTSEAFAIQSLALAVETLPLVLREPGNLEKRSQMQQASMLAGLAISQTRTAIAHSISYPLTIHFGVPHGLACSFTLRELLNRNLEKIATSTYEKSILIQVLNLLKSLNLAKRVCEYVSLEGVLDLKDEMWAGGRADNFTGEIYQGLDELLKNSLETASQ